MMMLLCCSPDYEMIERPGEEIDYEDTLVKRRRRRRRRRQANQMHDSMQHGQANVTLENDLHYHLMEVNATHWPDMPNENASFIPPAEYEKMMQTVVYGALHANITGLDHFQDYIIEVVACHDPIVGEEAEKLCSKAAIVMARTAPDRKLLLPLHRSVCINLHKSHLYAMQFWQ